MIVEVVIGGLHAGIDREPREVRTSPAQSTNCLGLPGLLDLAEAAENRRAAGVDVLVVAALARRQPDQLDRATAERARDVAADFEAGLIVPLEQLVIMFGPARRDHVVGLRPDAVLVFLDAGVEVDRMVGRRAKRPVDRGERLPDVIMV